MEHIEARTALVDYLEEQGLVNQCSVKKALLQVPRHKFIKADPIDVYTDQALIIKSKGKTVCSTISQPSIVAHMLEELDVCPGQKVLEIGTGLGYNAALLSTIAGPNGMVVTIEYDKELARNATDNLNSYKNVQVISGDGRNGFQQNAPFDRIIVTVTADDLYHEWQEQLSPEGGRILLPLELTSGITRLLSLNRNKEKLSGKFGWPVRFVAMAGEKPSASGMLDGLLSFVQIQNLSPSQKDALLFFCLFNDKTPNDAFKQWKELKSPDPHDFVVTKGRGPFSRIFPSVELSLTLGHNL